jgi:predicted anti-sigma-YlaC factor YlaD
MGSRREMDCARVEALLPGYVARELGADESSAVATHVESCARCREALASLAAIEATLVARRDQIPPADAFLGWALAAVSRARRPAYAKVLRAAVSVPGSAILLVTWASFLIARYQSRALGDTAAFERVSGFAKRGLDAIVAVAGGDAVTLTAVYGALAIAVIVSAGALTVRFVRD